MTADNRRVRPPGSSFNMVLPFRLMAGLLWIEVAESQIGYPPGPTIASVRALPSA